jgi:UDPglucose 6-dehydrogenase
MSKYARVTTIGLWHLGSVTSACFAAYGHSVVGIDPDEAVARNLSKGITPIYEPGLGEMIKGQLNRSLSFTTDFKKGLRDSEYVAITFDTPVNDDDTPNLDPILKSIEKAIPFLKDGVLLVVSSQVPIGTCERIRDMIKKRRPSLDFGIACIPENLKLGEAIERFMSPDLLVIGAENERDFEKARGLYGFVKGPILHANLRTAEMVKHAINAFLACQISLSNELGNFCDNSGVDWLKVSAALHLDKRIGPNAMLHAGLGFGGGTLARDVGVLRRTGRQNGTETAMLDAIITVNDRQNAVIIGKLRSTFGKLKGLRVGVLGLTYKPGTSAIRRSASIAIIKELAEHGVKVSAYDPKAEFKKSEVSVSFERCKTPESVADGSNALLLLTGWPEFKDLDFKRIKAKMKNHVIVDALNMLDPEKLSRYGFSYIGIGRGLKSGTFQYK